MGIGTVVFPPDAWQLYLLLCEAIGRGKEAIAAGHGQPGRDVFHPLSSRGPAGTIDLAWPALAIEACAFC